jgi:hypothetical protein
LISWKHSFKRLNEEYELANKKKNALDNLYAAGRISQSTRDSFNNDIVAAITDIEKQQKDLLAKMETKVNELQSQIKTLEMLLANYEIQHVVGEIDEDTYQHEITLLGTGLETTKRELDTIREAATQLCPLPPEVAMEPPAPPPPAEAVAPAPEPEVELTPPIENAPIPEAPAEVESIPPLCPQETITNTPEPMLEEAPMENTEQAPTEEAPIENTEQTATETVTENIAEPTEEAPIETPPENTAETATENVVDLSEQAPTENMPENTEQNEDENIAENMVEPSEEAPIESPPENVEEIAEAETEDIVEPILENTVVIPETMLSPLTQETQPTENIIIVEEATQEAHPHIAPKEAQQEITSEAIAENTEDAEENHPAAEASPEENSEQQNS